MLEETAAVIRQAIAEGKSLVEIKEEKMLGKWDRYSWSFIPTDRHAEQLFRGLQAGRAEP